MVQFWLNVPDGDAENYIRIFTMLGRKETEELIIEHQKNPHLRLLQNKLAEEVTIMIHSREEFVAAISKNPVQIAQPDSGFFV